MQVRTGYTLLELMIVVTLMALVVGTASVKLVAPYRMAQADSILERIQSVDRLARRVAKRKRDKLTLQATDNTLFLSDRRGVRLPSSVIPLRPHFELIRFRQLGGDNDQVVEFNGRGQSPTYAIELSDRIEDRHWILFLGLTGEAIPLDSERELEEIF